MIYEGTLNPGSFKEFNMRVKIRNKLDIGAISLAFKYPQEFLEVVGVKLFPTGEELMFTAQEGVLKTGWYNLQPLVTNEEDVLLDIRFRSRDLTSQTMPISVMPDEGCEIAGPYANVFNGITLVAPVIPAVLTGIDPALSAENTLPLSFYPNPAKDKVRINWNLPEPGHVVMTITDLLGRMVKQAVNDDFSQGEQSISLDVSDLPSGVYLFRLKFSTPERAVIVTRKMIVE
jgi:hypothetical protein